VRHFSTLTKLSPSDAAEEHEYLSDVWVGKALEVLKAGPMTIGELAKAVGHPNPRSLAGMFNWGFGFIKYRRDLGKWEVAS